MAGADAGQWYWCMEHGRAEDAAGACAPAQRLGPYGSKEEAGHWKDRVEARNDRWEKEDREWEGEGED